MTALWFVGTIALLMAAGIVWAVSGIIPGYTGIAAISAALYLGFTH